MTVTPLNVAPDPRPIGRPADDELLARFARGEKLAFETLMAAHQARITATAFRLLGWRGDVEAVVQDVFLAAWTQRRRFRGRSRLDTWLLAITIRQCRRQRRRWWVGCKWRQAVQRMPCPAPESPDAAVSAVERAGRVRDAVAALPAGEREVVVLYYLEQLPVAELSSLLGITPNAADVRLHRARQRLRGTLDELMEDR